MTAAHERAPDLTISGLRLWVHGRQFPASDDYWDGNWVVVTAECQYPQSLVRAGGPIVHLSEVASLLEGCQAIYQTLRGTAALACMEPNLRVELAMDALGHVKAVVALTPDHMTEEHTFRSELDQSYLPPIIAECRSILERFPLKGRP